MHLRFGGGKEMEESLDMIRVDVSAVDEDGDVDLVLHVTDEGIRGNPLISVHIIGS